MASRPEVSLFKVFVAPDAAEKTSATLTSGYITQGPKVEELEQIDGIWVPTLMTMTTKRGKQLLHKTILRTSDVKFGQDLDFDMFSVRGLETGP